MRDQLGPCCCFFASVFQQVIQDHTQLRFVSVFPTLHKYTNQKTHKTHQQTNQQTQKVQSCLSIFSPCFFGFWPSRLILTPPPQPSSSIVTSKPVDVYFLTLVLLVWVLLVWVALKSRSFDFHHCTIKPIEI